MQQESAAKCSAAERVKTLRIRTQKTWDGLAADLDLHVSMLYQVARGSKHLSAKALYRLEQAERAAGIEPPVVTVKEAVRRIETATEDELDFYKAHNVAGILESLRDQMRTGTVTLTESLKRLDLSIRFLRAPAKPVKKKKGGASP
jgi:hypothetical protein